MKFTIHGFSQKKLIEKNLTHDDAMILRWFVDYSATGRMKKQLIDGEIFLFVRYQSIIEEFPILGVNSCDAMAKRLRKIVKSGILEKKVVKKGGVFPYYRLNPEEYQKLISSTPVEKNKPAQKSDHTDENSDGSKTQPEAAGSKIRPSENTDGTNFYPSTNNPSTNPSIINPNLKKQIVEKIISKLSNVTGFQYRKNNMNTEKRILALLKKGFTEQDIEKVIRYKFIEWGKDEKMRKYLRPQTLFGNKFEDYLEESGINIPQQTPKEQVDQSFLKRMSQIGGSVG